MIDLSKRKYDQRLSELVEEMYLAIKKQKDYELVLKKEKEDHGSKIFGSSMEAEIESLSLSEKAQYLQGLKDYSNKVTGYVLQHLGQTRSWVRLLIKNDFFIAGKTVSSLGDSVLILIKEDQDGIESIRSPIAEYQDSENSSFYMEFHYFVK